MQLPLRPAAQLEKAHGLQRPRNTEQRGLSAPPGPAARGQAAFTASSAASASATRPVLAAAAATCAAARTLTRRKALVTAPTSVTRQTETPEATWPEPQGQLHGKVFLWQKPFELPLPFPNLVASIFPQHSVVFAKCEEGGYAAFDFEPIEKHNFASVLWLLAGGEVKGRFRARWMSSLPKGAIALGDASETAEVTDVTVGVNKRFWPRLALNSNDCHTYSDRVLRAILADPVKPLDNKLFSTVNLDEIDTGKALAYKEPSVFNAAVLVAGTTIGAGALALPAATQAAGFVPSTFALFFAWLYMASTGLLTAEVTLSTMATSGSTSTSLQSMAAKTLGPSAAFMASVAFAFLHFALMVAYLSRGGELLADLFPMLLSASVPMPLIFAAIFGSFIFVTKGTDLLDQVNNAFAFLVAASFLVLVALAAPLCDASQLLDTADWSKAAGAMPIVILSLAYHNVVPTVCSQLEGDRSKISTAIVGGSFVPFLMFVMWNAAVLAAIPAGAPPGADPLQLLQASGGPLVSAGVVLFSLGAIVTSFNGLVLSLTDFFQDLVSNIGLKDDGSSFWPKVRNFSLTMALPIVVACSDPTLFFQALDTAGAFGDATLFGLLPALMALQLRAAEPRVLAKDPSLMGGYPRGPLVSGGEFPLVLAALVALAIVGNKAADLLS